MRKKQNPAYELPVNMKRCSKCKVLKERSKFSADKSQKDLLHRQCKDCTVSNRRRYLDTHPQDGSVYYHKRKEVNGEKSPSSAKTCARCKKHLPGSAFYREKSRPDGLTSWCKDCFTLRQATIGRFAKYGLTPQDYETMWLVQEGKCWICEVPGNKKQRSLRVDHDHKTGIVRGLLCSSCNLVLGLLKDNVALFEKAIRYLSQRK